MSNNSLFFVFLIFIHTFCDYNNYFPLELTFNYNVTSEIDFILKINTKQLIDGDFLTTNCSCHDVSFLLTGTNLVVPFFLEGGCNTNETIYWLRYNETLYNVGVEISGENFVNHITFLFSNLYYEYEVDSGRYDVDMKWLLPFLGDRECPSFSSSFVLPSKEEIDITGGKTETPARFFRIGTSNGIRGTNSHTHSISGSTEYTHTSTQKAADGISQFSNPSHSHQLDFDLQESENEPPSFNVGICLSSSSSFEIFEQQLVFSANLSSSDIVVNDEEEYKGNWRALDEDKVGKFIRFVTPADQENALIKNSYGFIHDEGYYRHVHELPGTIGISNDDGKSMLVSVINAEINAVVGGEESSKHHSHGTLTSSFTWSEDDEEKSITVSSQLISPPYREIVVVIANDSKISPFGQMSLLVLYKENNSTSSSFSPPYGWIDETNSFDSNLLRTVLEIQTKETIEDNDIFHSHQVYGYTQTPSGVYKAKATPGTRKTLVSLNHIHSFNLTSSSSDSVIPLNFPVRLLTRKQDVSSSLLSSAVFNMSVFENSWKCFNIERKLTSSVCGGNGYCLSTDTCICDDTYYGDECMKRIQKGQYSESDIIDIEYSILVDVLIAHPNSSQFGNQYFDCSLIIQQNSFLENEQQAQCSWISQNIVRTSTLRISNVNSYFKSLNLYILSDSLNQQIISVDISPYNSVVDNQSSVLDTGTFFLIFSIVFSPVFVFILFLVAVLCCICFCFVILLSILFWILQKTKGKLNKFKEIDDIDLLLKEQEDKNSDSSLAKIKINKNLFEIQFDEISVLQKIGEGGSNSFVFKAMWRSRPVAFKCYKATDVITDQQSFNEFENEVKILASVHHPCILAFYGASLLPPRIGILMEFCARGDLKKFLISYRQEQQQSFDVFEKLRILIEVASAMFYLHSKGIIHRDLKAENVLITENLNSKVMDFGLSKMLREQQLEKNNMTKMVGTSYYMSPEVTLGNQYDEKCDVFSYGILIYVLLTERFSHPYGDDENLFNIEMKVANSPHFRPPLSPEIMEEHFSFCLNKKKAIVEFMKMCWSHDPFDRPSFSEVLTEMMNIKKGKGKEQQQQQKENDDEGERIRRLSFFVEKEQKQKEEKEEEEENSSILKLMKTELNVLKKQNQVMKSELKKLKEEQQEEEREEED